MARTKARNHIRFVKSICLCWIHGWVSFKWVYTYKSINRIYFRNPCLCFHHLLLSPNWLFHSISRKTLPVQCECLSVISNRCPKALKDIHVDDFILVIIPVIILHPRCTLWWLLCSCFESKPKYVWEWKPDRDNKYKQDVFKGEDAREFHSSKNDLVFFTSLSRPLVSCLSENPGFPASSEPH